MSGGPRQTHLSSPLIARDQAWTILRRTGRVSEYTSHEVNPTPKQSGLDHYHTVAHVSVPHCRHQHGHLSCRGAVIRFQRWNIPFLHEVAGYNSNRGRFHIWPCHTKTRRAMPLKPMSDQTVARGHTAPPSYLICCVICMHVGLGSPFLLALGRTSQLMHVRIGPSPTVGHPFLRIGSTVLGWGIPI